MLETIATSEPSEKPPRHPSWQSCYDILPGVSRTFALTIPILPRELMDSVCCAYLLCRIADTIEDHASLETSQKDHYYSILENLIQDPTDETMVRAFAEGWPNEGIDIPCQRLIEKTGDVLTAFQTLGSDQQIPIRGCVNDMVSGMRSMNRKPPVGDIVYVCSDLAELEAYCHYVAGTVGLMLTDLFGVHMNTMQPFSTDARREQGRRFGLGLQLTNILKDQAVDLDRKTSFIPNSWIDWSSLPATLKPNEKKNLIARTLLHLDEAHHYTLAIPTDYPGIRLFCLWAMWMAAASLREVAQSRAKVPKISRAEVSEIVAYSRAHIDSDALLEERFDQLRQEAASAANKL